MVKCVATLIYCAFAVNILAYVTNGDPVRLCRKRRFPYYIADSDQCDLFYKCKDGQITEELCPDGQVYEPESQACFMIQRVKCGRRKRLQSPQGNALCPRLYGRFPIENECFAYSECEQGTPTKVNCPPGLIFDIDQAVCEFPDMANRTECSAEKILDFTCPHGSNVQSDEVVLQFGDHERFPKKGDCRHFFMCLKSGRPRLGGCPLGTIYNPATFFCDKPENVPECENV
ncbi:protein obstructor-E-like [Daphnia pulex]|uniref:protein obstructor-E-like n=1 Tax=Daphnia pulex TaxID=6669 RepID=UPI001EDCA684|nr:protein obstructor-E-like [Daphnia pulex]